MKRYVSAFLCVFVLCAAPSAFPNDGPTNIPVLADGKTGYVGIGTETPLAKLDVYKGEIKIGSTGAACTNDLAGALRSADNKLQFCDGAGWRNVSLDKAQ